MIRRIEELSMNAWPAFHTLLLDGWVLRAAQGYTRRANSIAPLYPGETDLDEKIQACEAFYRARGLPVVYKLTGDSLPGELDQRLSELGYAEEARTSVQTLDLSDWPLSEESADWLGALPNEDYFASYLQASKMDARNQPLFHRLVASIQPQHCFVGLRVGGQYAAWGLGVLEDGWLGLFDILVDERQRRQGLGLRVVRSLLDWGRLHGARASYLQVMLNNPPALALYARIGYCALYPYWYRVRP